MKIRDDWRERLTKLVGDREKAPISRKADLNATYLRDILERSQTPLLKNAEKLSVALDVLVTDWFLEAPPAPQQIQTPLTIPDFNVQGFPRDVPTFSGAIAGEDGLFEFNGQVVDHVRRPPRLMGVKDAYALYVLRDCMAPWREHGELVYVHPHLPVKPLDYVVVQLKQETEGGPIPAYIKRLVRRSATDVRLLQYNPRKELTIQTKKIATIHKIMDWNELLGL